ncbi:hypothetical protein [Celeribacter halophilus]|uniref:hypothetical protein n=1 Tax=Celeribacter halophilus TaxID=576117 RepID=UPI003A91EFD3
MSKQLNHKPAKSTPSSVGVLSADPRRTIQNIQSGLVTKAVVNELSRAMDFANAVGQNFAAVLPDLNEQTRIEIFSALACNASSKDRRSIMEHPLCPAEVAKNVEDYDTAKAEEAKSRKAERAAEREKKERAKFEELRRKFEGANAETDDAAAGE